MGNSYRPPIGIIAASAARAGSEGPKGFSLASMWMPDSGLANLGRWAKARWASVRPEIEANAEEAAATRRKLRREKPLQAIGSETGADIGRTPKDGMGWESDNREHGYKNDAPERHEGTALEERPERKIWVPYFKVALERRNDKVKVQRISRSWGSCNSPC